MLERMSASPGMARATLEAGFSIDVRPILPTIGVPTLVAHARGDPGVPVQFGRYLADNIPGARLLEVDGNDHAPWMTDPDRVLSEVEEFLTGGHAAPSQSQRATVQSLDGCAQRRARRPSVAMLKMRRRCAGCLPRPRGHTDL